MCLAIASKMRLNVQIDEEHSLRHKNQLSETELDLLEIQPEYMRVSPERDRN